MAALDLMTPAEASKAIADPKADPVRLAGYVSGVSILLDGACGPIVRRDVTEERHSGGAEHVILTLRPVDTIATVIEWRGVDSVTVLERSPGVEPAEGYLARTETDPTGTVRLTGRLDRYYSSARARWWSGVENVVVTYNAGRYADTDAVAPLFKEACRLTLRHLWRTEAATTVNIDGYDVPVASFPTFALPNAVAEMLERAGELRAFAHGGPRL